MFSITKNQSKNKWIPFALALAILAAAQPQMTAQAEQPAPAGMTVQNNTLEKQQYIIAQDGTGDFQTIQEGVDNASDGDTLIVYHLIHRGGTGDGQGGSHYRSKQRFMYHSV